MVTEGPDTMVTFCSYPGVKWQQTFDWLSSCFLSPCSLPQSKRRWPRRAGRVKYLQEGGGEGDAVGDGEGREVGRGRGGGCSRRWGGEGGGEGEGRERGAA